MNKNRFVIYGKLYFCESKVPVMAVRLIGNTIKKEKEVGQFAVRPRLFIEYLFCSRSSVRRMNFDRIWFIDLIYHIFN